MIGTVLVAGTAFWLSRHIAEALAESTKAGLAIAGLKIKELTTRHRDRREVRDGLHAIS